MSFHCFAAVSSCGAPKSLQSEPTDKTRHEWVCLMMLIGTFFLSKSFFIVLYTIAAFFSKLESETCSSKVATAAESTNNFGKGDFICFLAPLLSVSAAGSSAAGSSFQAQTRQWAWGPQVPWAHGPRPPLIACLLSQAWLALRGFPRCRQIYSMDGVEEVFEISKRRRSGDPHARVHTRYCATSLQTRSTYFAAAGSFLLP